LRVLIGFGYGYGEARRNRNHFDPMTDVAGNVISYRELLPDDRRQFSPADFDKTLLCPVCKRFRVEWEYTTTVGVYQVCERCSNYVHQHGMDDDVLWMIKNTVADDQVNLRFTTAKHVRLGHSGPVAVRCSIDEDGNLSVE
jgi:hypothetical protein